MEGFSDKCRFCLEDMQNFENSINEEIESLFTDLTKIHLIHSPFLSSNLCLLCYAELMKICSFRSQLIMKQTFLMEIFNESQNETTQAKVEKAEIEICELEHNISTELPFFRSIDENEMLSSDEPFSDVIAVKKLPKKKKKLKPADEYPDNACPICAKKFTEKRKIPLHIKRIHVKIKDFHCESCDYSAYTKFDVIRHVKNIHCTQTEPTDRRICPDCGKVVRGNNQLTLHIRKKHLNIKKFKCDLCSFASYGKYEIRSHLEHMHIPKQFKQYHPCELCPSILSSSMGLKVHIQHKHSGLKPHSCFCGKSFSLRETLKTHIRNVHKGERKFVCPIKSCEKRFGQAVRLRDHINNNHGVKQEIPCTLCSKIFHSTRNLKAHLVYHDEPKFICSHCSKKFYLSNKLKEHLRTHDISSAWHTCHFCNRKFQLMSSLKRHLKMHQLETDDDH